MGSRRSFLSSKSTGGGNASTRNNENGGVQHKLEIIGDYIAEEAARLHQGDIMQVGCPTESEWLQLAAGRRARLPATGALHMVATDQIRALATKNHLSLLATWFECARSNLARRRAKEASK